MRRDILTGLWRMVFVKDDILDPMQSRIDRRIATRYETRSQNYLAMLTSAAILFGL